MARPRIHPDDHVPGMILDAFLEGGARAVSFRLIAAKAGLSPAALVGRFGTGEAMLQAGLAHGWDRQMAALEAARPGPGGEGGKTARAQAFLKAASHPEPALVAASLGAEPLAARAGAWRGAMVQELQALLGDRENAEMAFAAWSARQLWGGAGGKGFRLGAMLRRLG